MTPSPAAAPTFTERALMRVFRTVIGGGRAALPDWGARPYRVLLLQHGRVGDMVASTGLIRAIVESHPTVQLDVLASRDNAAVLDGVSGLGEVIVVDGVDEQAGPGEALRAGLGAARVLRGRGYDAVVDGLVLNLSVSWMTATLLHASGAPRRIGVRECAGRWRGGVEAHYTHAVAAPEDLKANQVEYLECLAGAFGVARSAVPHPQLVITAVESALAERTWFDAARAQHGETMDLVGGPRVLVNVSAGTPERRWDDAQFVEAIRYARAAHAGATVVVVGEPGERGAVEAIAARAGATAPRTACVRDAFALVARADGVITPDTSVAHAASAFRKPCVTLALPIQSSAAFTPYRTPGRVVKSPTAVMRDLAVESVTPAIAGLYALIGGYAGTLDRVRRTPGVLAAA